MIGDIIFRETETREIVHRFQFIGTMEEREKFTRAVMLGKNLSADILEVTDSLHVENAMKSGEVKVEFLYAGFSDWFDIDSDAFDEKNILISTEYDPHSTLYDIVEGLVGDFFINHTEFGRYYYYTNPTMPAPNTVLFDEAAVRAAIFNALTDEGKSRYQKRELSDWAEGLKGWRFDEESNCWHTFDPDDGILGYVDDLPKVFVLIRTEQK